MGKKLVAETLALMGILDETCHVDEFDGCQRNLFRLKDLCQFYNPIIRHCNNADIGFNGAKRIGLAGHSKGSQGIENG
jgi:hypothetical protein